MSERPNYMATYRALTHGVTETAPSITDVFNVEAAKEVKVGTVYMVPCVRTSESSPCGDSLFPVLGPLHEDGDFIPPAAFPHWHIDWRFLLKERPADVGFVIPESWVPQGELQRWPLVCLQLTPPWPGIPFWFANLERAYKSMRACDNICPHRGFSLVGAPEDRNGVRVCPGHGLAWDKSGALVSRSGGALMFGLPFTGDTTHVSLNESVCACWACVQACKTASCWPTAPEAARLILAGYSKHLMQTAWKRANGKKVYLLIPGTLGFEGKSKKDLLLRQCTFLTDANKCMLHDQGLKPLEGRLAHHTVTDGQVAKMEEIRINVIIASWDTNEARDAGEYWVQAMKTDTWIFDSPGAREAFELLARMDHQEAGI